MAYCVPLGIPHSRFLSWDETDQDKAIAYQWEQAEHCPHCGTRDEDWRDSKGRLLDPPPLVVKEMRCAGCEVREQHKRDLDSMGGDDVRMNTTGIQLSWRRFDPVRDGLEDDE